MDKEKVLNELKFKALRSSGPGGQHVNKVSSKVELLFDVQASAGLTNMEKERILKKMGGKLSKQHLLLLQCDETRSQHKNKELVIKRFLALITKALQVAKKRKPTKPSKSAVEKRLKSKKIVSGKKSSRKPPDLA